jgi:hypothetical protein
VLCARHVHGSYRTCSNKVRYGFDAYRTRESSSIRYIRYDTYRMYRGEPDPRSRSLAIRRHTLRPGLIMGKKKKRVLSLFSVLFVQLSCRRPCQVRIECKMLDENRPCTVQIGGGVLLSFLSRPRPAPLFCLKICIFIRIIFPNCVTIDDNVVFFFFNHNQHRQKVINATVWW